MKNLIEEYVRKIIEIGCNIQENDNLVIYLTEEIPFLEEILLNLKKEYKINQIIFVKDYYEEIYNFLKQNPTSEEITKFIKKYPKIENHKKTKIITLSENDYQGYYYKLCYEMYEQYKKYLDIYEKINEDFITLYEKSPKIVVSLPSKSWAENILGSTDKLEELWNIISQTLPEKGKLIKEIKILEELKKYLNSIKIRELTFYTDKGTYFRIKIPQRAIWNFGKIQQNGIAAYPNFPTYEIYTSPNYKTAEGKIIVTKPSVLYGMQITEAELEFHKGRIIRSKSDNEMWEKTIKFIPNHLNRIGEIALVSTTSPIAQLNRNLNSTLLDENTGCHLALGYSIPCCIDLPKELIESKGKRNYNFNESLYHQDLIFGDSTITVEAKTANSKVLILENGKWKI